MLVDPSDDLGTGIAAAFRLVQRPGRAKRARSVVEGRYSIDTMAAQLVDLYRSEMVFAMSLLVLSPEFVSHYGPLAVVAKAARLEGSRVVVATGPSLRRRVEADGLEWRHLQLGAGSNSGVAECDPGIARFIAATREGPIQTIRRQALERERDLLWQPEQVAADIARLCDEVEPDQVLVDHVSFGSTLAMYATGRRFATLVPGHPSQLPIGTERYGVPDVWPLAFRPDPEQLAAIESLADRVSATFTDRWNTALASIAPGRPAVADAFRVHGDSVLYNSLSEMQAPSRRSLLDGDPGHHQFVGPLGRDEELPEAFRTWSQRVDGRPQVFVSLGTFLSYRSDVLTRLADAIRLIGGRAAIATGATSVDDLGPLPDDWIVASQLPQVALLRHADLAVHHGGNNSVQESLAAGVRQLVLPFSTDQFSNAADLERVGAAAVVSPNDARAAEFALTIEVRLAGPPPEPTPVVATDQLAQAVFERTRE